MHFALLQSLLSLDTVEHMVDVCPHVLGIANDAKQSPLYLMWASRIPFLWIKQQVPKWPVALSISGNGLMPWEIRQNEVLQRYLEPWQSYSVAEQGQCFLMDALLHELIETSLTSVTCALTEAILHDSCFIPQSIEAAIRICWPGMID